LLFCLFFFFFKSFWPAFFSSQSLRKRLGRRNISPSSFFFLFDGTFAQSEIGRVEKISSSSGRRFFPILLPCLFDLSAHSLPVEVRGHRKIEERRKQGRGRQDNMGEEGLLKLEIIIISKQQKKNLNKNQKATIKKIRNKTHKERGISCINLIKQKLNCQASTTFLY